MRQAGPCAHRGDVFRFHRVLSPRLPPCCRYYQDRGEDALSTETVVGIVQEQLRKANFEAFNRIAEQCTHHDAEQYV